VIGRLLGQLVPAPPGEPPAAPPGGLNVIVVANGCTDDTAEVAASFGPQVRVISIPVASKHAALVAGGRAAQDFPRVYADADVEFRAEDVHALAAALQQPGILAVAPERVLPMSGRPWPVRWHYEVWTRLPEVRRGLFGRGVIAVNRSGQERLASLPPRLADDLAASLLFAPDEREIVPGAQVIIHVPCTVADFLRRRVRAVAGVSQIERARQEPGPSARTHMADLLAIVRSEPRMAPRVALFVVVAVLSRLLARRALSRSDYSTWLRDESSRNGQGAGRDSSPGRDGKQPSE